MKQENKKIYKVYVKGQLMKEYDNPLQAYTWLHIHRFIGAGKGYLFLLRDSKIVVEEKEPESEMHYFPTLISQTTSVVLHISQCKLYKKKLKSQEGKMKIDERGVSRENPAWEELFEFLDKREFSVLDMLACACTPLRRLKEKEFNTTIMVGGEQFKIDIKKKR